VSSGFCGRPRTRRCAHTFTERKFTHCTKSHQNNVKSLHKWGDNATAYLQDSEPSSAVSNRSAGCRPTLISSSLPSPAPNSRNFADSPVPGFQWSDQIRVLTKSGGTISVILTGGSQREEMRTSHTATPAQRAAGGLYPSIILRPRRHLRTPTVVCGPWPPSS
jgi:hypothetical protein